MRTFWTFIFFALAGCTTNNAPSPAIEEAVDWHKGMPTSIPGQPEKATVPSITSGGEGDPCTETREMQLDSYFGGLVDLVKGEIESVTILMEPIVDQTTGEQISFAECREKDRFSIILKVVMKDSTSLFDGEVGTTEFFIPREAIYQMGSKPSFFYEGRWYPRNETPARIDGSVGWSKPLSGLQAGQVIMVPLVENYVGHLNSWLYPIFQEVDGTFQGQSMSVDCAYGPDLFSQPFVWEDVVDAYQTLGAKPTEPFWKKAGDLPVTTYLACNESPRNDPPVIESDAGVP